MKKLTFIITALAMAWYMGGCVNRYSKNVPYTTAPFSDVQLLCDSNDPVPCEAVTSALYKYKVTVSKKSKYVAKVNAVYGKNEASAGSLFFGSGAATGYAASKKAEGLIGLGVSVYEGETFISRAAMDVTEGTLNPDNAADYIVRSLMNKNATTTGRR